MSCCLLSALLSRRSLSGSPEFTVRTNMRNDAASRTRAEMPRRRRMNLSTRCPFTIGQACGDRGAPLSPHARASQAVRTSGRASPLLRVPHDARLRGRVTHVLEVGAVRTDTRVSEQRDAEQRVPELLLDHLGLLDVHRLVGGRGEGLPRLVDDLVRVAAVVLRLAGRIDVLTGGLLARAGPGEQRDLVVTVGQVLVEELRR